MSVSKLPSGAWRIRIGAGRNPDGTYRVLTQTLPPHATATDRKIAELALRIQAGHNTPDPNTLTVTQITRLNIEQQAPQRAPKTSREYAGTVRRWLTNTPLGNTPIRNVRTAQIDSHYQAMSQQVGVAEIRRLHSALKGGFRWAIAADLITNNPTLNVTAIPKTRRSTVTATHPTTYRTALANTTGPLHALIRLIGTTGVRKSEAIALRWKDLTHNTANINGALTTHHGTIVRGPTKTHTHRIVHLPPDLTTLLDTIRLEQAATCAATPGAPHTPDNYIWSRHGCGILPWRPDTTTKRIAATGVKAGELRHMVATQLIAAGMSPVDVANVMGHASPRMTLDVYSHPVDGHLERAATILANL